jgi:hypothetical protein
MRGKALFRGRFAAFLQSNQALAKFDLLPVTGACFPVIASFRTKTRDETRTNVSRETFVPLLSRTPRHLSSCPEETAKAQRREGVAGIFAPLRLCGSLSWRGAPAFC